MKSKHMKALVLMLLASAPMAFAGTIVGSPHDLSNPNVSSNDAAAVDNGETCVYCHTPHAANTDFDGAPLWNKGTSATPTTFVMYGATVAGEAGTTIAGTATLPTPASPSLACLSCHDGISAIDSIVNAPGSGMNTVTGSNDIVTALTTTYGGNIGGTPGIPTVGTEANLANDHPVSIPYLGDGTATSPASLRATTFDLSTYGDNVPWLGATTIADLLRNGNVECGSCHDPHNGGKTQGTDTEVNFLRHSNTSSNLCVGCHAK